MSSVDANWVTRELKRREEEVKRRLERLDHLKAEVAECVQGISILNDNEYHTDFKVRQILKNQSTIFACLLELLERS